MDDIRGRKVKTQASQQGTAAMAARAIMSPLFECDGPCQWCN